MGNDVLEIVGRNIVRLMNKKGISQSDLARGIDVHVTAVNKWVKGHNSLTMGNAQKIADFFGVSMNDLMTEQANYEQIEDVNYLMRELPGASEDEARAMRLYWENIVKRERYD